MAAGSRADGGGGSERGLARSFAHALSGLVEATATERNMKVHVLAGLALGIAGGALALPTSTRLALLVCAMLVLAAELVNTALESLVDLHTQELRPEARRVKDHAAAAVLVLAAGSLLAAVAGVQGSFGDVVASLSRLRADAAMGAALLLVTAFLLLPGRRALALDVLGAAAGAVLLALLALRSISPSFTALASGLFALAVASAFRARGEGGR